MGIFRELSTSEILQVVGGNAAVSVGIPGVSNMGGEGEASRSPNHAVAQDAPGKAPDVIDDIITYSYPDSGSGTKQTYDVHTYNVKTGEHIHYENRLTPQGSNNQGQSSQQNIDVPINFQAPSGNALADALAASKKRIDGHLIFEE
jgi:hypothetical protein